MLGSSTNFVCSRSLPESFGFDTETDILTETTLLGCSVGSLGPTQHDQLTNKVGDHAGVIRSHDFF